jgi:hypothetical protein
MRIQLLGGASAWLFVVACSASEPAIGSDAGVLGGDAVQVADAGGKADRGAVSGDASTANAEACPVEIVGGQTALYDHQVQRATSTDGVNFARDDRVLLEHASVPDATIGPDGKTWIYFVNGRLGQHAVFVARLEGDAFQIFDCVRIDGKVNPNAVDPDIIKLADGRYRLFYYQGWFDGTPEPPGSLHPIYSAVSDDGVHFKSEGKVFEQEKIMDPSVAILADGSWLMSLNGGEKTLLASSVDGKFFSSTGTEFEAAISELHSFDGGKTVRLYLATSSGLKIKKSTDGGKNWVDEGTANVGGADPSLVEEPSGGYTLFVKSIAEGSKPPKPPTP